MNCLWRKLPHQINQVNTKHYIKKLYSRWIKPKIVLITFWSSIIQHSFRTKLLQLDKEQRSNSNCLQFVRTSSWVDVAKNQTTNLHASCEKVKFSLLNDRFLSIFIHWKRVLCSFSMQVGAYASLFKNCKLQQQNCLLKILGKISSK